MKKVIAATALVTIIGLTGFYQASANWGHRGMMGGWPGDCPQRGAQMTAPMDAETKAKFDKFFAETQDLRKQIVVKRAEKHALMNAENPDSAAVGKAAGDLFDLRNSMRTKAEAAGLEGFGAMGRRGWCDGPGYHHGRKGMKGGQGMRGGQGMNPQQ